MNTLSAETTRFVNTRWERPTPFVAEMATYVYQCMIREGVPSWEFGYNLYLLTAYLREATRD